MTEKSAPVPGRTMIRALLDRLVTEHTPETVVAAVTGLAEAIGPDAEPGAPFLTVIMRTEGARPEALQEALSSLAAQSERDFELVLVVHSAELPALARVTALLGEQPAWLQDRAHVEALAGGGRSAPLNLALERARGRYVAVFDDDDLLLERWVEAFAQAEVAAGGRLIRTRVGTQDVALDRSVEPAVTIASTIRDDYPPFDEFRHLQVNASPFMGWAFPRALFTRMGVRFREDLDLLEDWDVVLRGGTLLGVHHVDELTAVYRSWSTGDSSVAMSSSDRWAAAEAALLDEVDDAPILVDRGSVRRIRQLLDDSDALHALRLTRSWRLAQQITRAADAVRRLRPGHKR